MRMVTVTVRNTTGLDVKLQEGNAGVYVTRAVVKNGGTHKLSLNPNATYREYVLVRMPDNTALEPVFSSDDVVEFTEILIKKEGSEYVWQGISATPTPLPPPPPPPPEVIPAPPTGLVSNVKKYFGLGA